MIDHTAALLEANVSRFDGAWLDGEPVACKEHAETVDPATGLVSGVTGVCDVQTVSDAVDAAHRAQPAWNGVGAGKRAAILSKWALLIRRHADELALLESLNMGMPLSRAHAFSVRACFRNLEYFASWADKLYSNVVPLPGGGDRAFDYTRHEPYGVVAVIAPWNTPAFFVGSRCGPALATGNTVVLKPSEMSSWTALRLAELATEAGMPAGVLNVVTGEGEAGAALCSHPRVGKISFTGSGPTGTRVLQLAAAAHTPCTTELGGKSALVVFDDAELDRAAVAAAEGAFGLSGQACMASSRVYVQRAVVDAFLQRLEHAANDLVVGDPLTENTDLGPIVSATQCDRVLSYVDLARADGATVAAGGKRLGGNLAGGYFVAPTVLTGLPMDSKASREEIFGPVVSVNPFDDGDEALAAANDSDFGLAAGVFTNSLRRAHQVAHALEAGTVWVNAWGVVPNAAPFGGYKRSGSSRDGGHEALLEYTQVKNVYVAFD